MHDLRRCPCEASATFSVPIILRNGHKAPLNSLGHLRLRELKGSLKRRYKHPSPTSINGYHAAKKLLSQSPAKRPTFAFADESGYTLAFANRIAHSGLHAETGAFPPSSTARLCAASEIAPERIAGESGCTPYGVCPLSSAPQPRWAAQTDTAR